MIIRLTRLAVIAVSCGYTISVLTALNAPPVPSPPATPTVPPIIGPVVTPRVPAAVTPTPMPFVTPTAPPVITPTVLPSPPPSSAAPPPTVSFVTSRSLRSTGVPATPPTATNGLLLPEQVSATVQLRPTQSIAISSKRGIFALVGVKPDQLVEIAVQYPALHAGRSINAESLDGGQVLLQGPLLVGADGAIHFQFRAGHSPGINHVALHERAQELGLQFWVLDEQHPEKNPPVVNPGS
jgi:hypothetical protein